MQYAPSIDRFIWLMQGVGCNLKKGNPCESDPSKKGGYRLATARPADLIFSNGTAWGSWRLTPDVFGFATGTTFDYPDLSVGTNYLYMSWNARAPDCQKTNSCGLEVVRVPLSQIENGGDIQIDVSDPLKNDKAWGNHLTQNTDREVFWAGHNWNSTLRLYSWADDEAAPFSRDVKISSWANTAPLSATTPPPPAGGGFLFLPGDKGDGKASVGNSIIGATRSSNQLWFAWTVGADSNFPQPHIEMVTIEITPDTKDRFATTQQMQIWNNDYAFAFPALATNDCTGEIGLSSGFGGNGKYANHAVGFWGDFVLYSTTNSDFGPPMRYGDFFTIRQDPVFGLFDAFGYGINQVGTGAQDDIRHVLFGREACLLH